MNGQESTQKCSGLERRVISVVTQRAGKSGAARRRVYPTVCFAKEKLREARDESYTTLRKRNHSFFFLARFERQQKIRDTGLWVGICCYINSNIFFDYFRKYTGRCLAIDDDDTNLKHCLISSPLGEMPRLFFTNFVLSRNVCSK